MEGTFDDRDWFGFRWIRRQYGGNRGRGQVGLTLLEPEFQKEAQ
jgi:hypothetical protein